MAILHNKNGVVTNTEVNRLQFTPQHFIPNMEPDNQVSRLVFKGLIACVSQTRMSRLRLRLSKVGMLGNGSRLTGKPIKWIWMGSNRKGETTFECIRRTWEISDLPK
jgi:hypothetical protein